STWNAWTHRLENAWPHTAVWTANHPTEVINSNNPTRYLAPCAPKLGTAVIQVGSPKSLPIIPINEKTTHTRIKPMTPDKMASRVDMELTSIYASIRLGTQITTPA